MGDSSKRPKGSSSPVGRGGVSVGNQRRGVSPLPSGSGGARRIDLFNSQGTVQQDTEGVVLRNNLAFEITPLQSQRTPQAGPSNHGFSGGQNSPKTRPNAWTQENTSSHLSLEARELARPKSKPAGSPTSWGGPEPPDLPLENTVQDSQPGGGTSSATANTQNSPVTDEDQELRWADIEEDSSSVEGDADLFSMSDLNSTKKADVAYMEQWKWVRNVKREITSAFVQIPDLVAEQKPEDVVIDHHFTLDQQVLAPRHYLVILKSMEDRDAVLIGGPYYLRNRMIYTTPWEPGFDTRKILAKKMAVWLDLVNLDPMIEGVGPELLGTLGKVLQLAGVTDSNDGKFANVRGCVLMDMSQPLPTVLRLHMNNAVKLVKIRYDQLPDACYKCQERGHFARNCPKGKVNQANGKNPEDTDEVMDDFIPVKQKGKGSAGGKIKGESSNTANSNSFQALADPENEGDEDPEKAAGGNTEDLLVTNQSPSILQQPQSGTEAVSGQGGVSNPTGATPVAVEDNLNSNEAKVASAGAQMDLNSTPTKESQENTEEKKSRKLKKKEKKKAARKKKAEQKGHRGEADDENNNAADSAADQDSSSSEDESPDKGKFWKSAQGKKLKGEKETMETQARWEGHSEAPEETLPR
ncbi:hypothetical protein R1sor_018233 [Riccia sorocarpa]|uniref:CCHC-type domain-containing protein n=1 Tax=Riccia sorocarpa TaxID=122646 RepID=A0ABD3ID60_9MARC